jgi:CelD/BcsL family acetyltransferase involved in cellulose biosynthesis
MALLPLEQIDSRVSGTSGIVVHLLRDWPRASSRLSAGHRTAFQHRHWLGAWYGSFDGIDPLVAVISDAATGSDIAVLPMISHVRRGIRVVEFADLGISDNNAPILAEGAALDEAGRRAIATALVGALRAAPDGFDLLRLKKMPADVGGVPNPLLVLGREGSSSVNGNLVLPGEDYAAYSASLRRLQLPRCWRVFTRLGNARFEIATDLKQAGAILDVMDVQQERRMEEIGSTFVLNDATHARFYRDVARRGITDGYAVISALVCDKGIMSSAFGVRCGATYYLLRISHTGRAFGNFSPGLLVIERTMAELHAQGVRRFDLSIGNQDYKRRLGAERSPLTDVSVALSWRGVPFMLRDQAAQAMRRHPSLAGLAARLAGRTP